MLIGFKNTDPYLPVQTPVKGGLYHTTWAKKGCVWRCVGVNIDNKTVTLRTPKTKRLLNWNVPWSELLHTRKTQMKIQRK